MQQKDVMKRKMGLLQRSEVYMAGNIFTHRFKKTIFEAGGLNLSFYPHHKKAEYINLSVARKLVL